jgi:hypothetical protein
MTNSIAKMYFQMAKKVHFVPSTQSVDVQKLASLMENLYRFGYTLSPKAVEALGDDNIEYVYKMLDSVMNDLYGANKKWEPMYPNFPQQVAEASKSELLINALLHYYGDCLGVRILPQYMKEERPKLQVFEDINIIELGDMEDFASIIQTRLNSNTEYTPQLKEDITFLATKHFAELEKCFPETIVNKENMAFLVGLLHKNGKSFSSLVKTATDLLRIAVVLSDGDISLATPTKFRSFKRSERKMILELLDGISHPLEDMRRHREKWLRLGRGIHPQEFANRFPNANRAFDIIRNNPKIIETFNSKVEMLLEKGDVVEASRLLKERPTEYARRLNKLLSFSRNEQEVLKNFIDIAPQVSEKVLLELMAYFASRSLGDIRVFFPKGNTAKAKTIDENRVNLPFAIRSTVQTELNNALIGQYKKKDPLGKVYIDPELKNYVVPFANRSASKGLVTHTRGTRLPIMNGTESIGDTIRFFIWWKNLERPNNELYYGERVDIDLSACLFDENWKYLNQISYTNLRDTDMKLYHSGDVTSAPNGACEFLDVDMKGALKHGGRYIVMCVFSFTGQSFSDLPECFAGWMERTDAKSGEIFEPKTVKNKVDIDSDANTMVPLVIDLKERNIIWMDLTIASRQNMYNNTHSTYSSVGAMGKAITSLKKPDMYTLAYLNARARGTIVDNPEEADVKFTVEKGVRPENYECL